MASMDKPRVLYYKLEKDDPRIGMPDFAEVMLSEHMELISVAEAEGDPELAATIRGAITLGGWQQALAELLKTLPHLQVVCSWGAGYDHLLPLLDNFKERNVQVGYLPDAVTMATADFAWALLLASARDILPATREATGPDHVKGFYFHALMGSDVSGSTLGIVGLGRIGLQVARRTQGFNMNILYHNRKPRSKEEMGGVKATFHTSLHDMLPLCDFVVITCPLTPQTHHLFDATTLAKMKPSATLINIARGGIVDTDALVEVLKRKGIRGAGLDVTDPEPLPQDHPLLHLDNVVLTAHKGSCDKGTRHRMWRETCDSLEAVLLHNTNIKQTNRLI